MLRPVVHSESDSVARAQQLLWKCLVVTIYVWAGLLAHSPIQEGFLKGLLCPGCYVDDRGTAVTPAGPSQSWGLRVTQ